MTENDGSDGERIPGSSADREPRLLRTHATKSPRIAKTAPYWSTAGWPTKDTMRLPTTQSPTPIRRIAYSVPQRVCLRVARSSRDRRTCRAYSPAVRVATDSIAADFIGLPPKFPRANLSPYISYVTAHYTSSTSAINSRSSKDRSVICKECVSVFSDALGRERQTRHSVEEELADC